MSALAEVLSRLAHDVRAPLGLAASALGELDASLGPEQRALTALAGKGLKRLERLAERLALAAELERGALRLDREPHGVRELSQQACARAAALEARRNVSLTLTLPVGEPALQLAVDAPRLVSALAELVGNAWRHARSQIEVIVRESDGLEVAVEDDGAGVSEAARPWLFTRFEPAAGRAAGNLGLTLARAVARAHGGEVTLEPAARTRFVLRLPP
ncbi:MAG: HAMP domain-containing histidine kinase [Deltaproteobacteria bacterium]|nr:HAMP domain-containing histidine kinase [Deltaproteobacteria bacterium]